MYLLIPSEPANTLSLFTFTSHYVSINSHLCCIYPLTYRNLHPTMYLLILYLLFSNFCLCLKFTSHYVSINSNPGGLIKKGLFTFTSHYVSINSILRLLFYVLFKSFTSHYVSINSRNY